MRIAGAIIAGGRSSRMDGKEKLFLKLGNERLLDRLMARLSRQTDCTIINANGDPARFAGVTVVPDIRTDISTPLAGLHAVLSWSLNRNFDAVLTVPSDAPFLPYDLLARLLDHGPAIAASGRQEHYLTGFWPVTLAPVMEQAINSNIFRVKDWAKLVKARIVEWPIAPHDPFFNINAPEDLAEARRIAAQFEL